MWRKLLNTMTLLLSSFCLSPMTLQSLEELGVFGRKILRLRQYRGNLRLDLQQRFRVGIIGGIVGLSAKSIRRCVE